MESHTRHPRPHIFSVVGKTCCGYSLARTWWAGPFALQVPLEAAPGSYWLFLKPSSLSKRFLAPRAENSRLPDQKTTSFPSQAKDHQLPEQKTPGSPSKTKNFYLVFEFPRRNLRLDSFGSRLRCCDRNCASLICTLFGPLTYCHLGITERNNNSLPLKYNILTLKLPQSKKSAATFRKKINFEK